MHSERCAPARAITARRAALAAVIVLLAAACGDAGRPPADTGARPGSAPEDPSSAPTPAGGDAGTGERPGAPADDVPAPRAGAEWTAGRAARDHGDGYVATLQAVRTARHDDYDRIVMDFGPGPMPSWRVEYVDRPVRQCGSGDPVDVAGDGWLSIHLQPARAHTDEGQATVTDRRRRLQLGVLRELVSTCDFEAHVEWVAGVAAPNRFRAFELSDPTRLVVDIAHGR